MITFVGLILMHVLSCTNAQHDADDFFIRTTSQPTLSPSNRPSTSSHPSFNPSLSPTKILSSQPSNQPSFSLQEFQFSLAIEFDELHVHPDKTSESILEEATNALIKKELDHDGDSFYVDTEILGSKPILPEEPKRNLYRLKNQARRRNQDAESLGLQILMNLIINVRSETTFTASVLIERMKVSLDQIEERESFILQLQNQDQYFSPINSIINIIINDEEIILATQKQIGASSRIYMVIALSLAAIVVLAFLLIVHRRSRKMDIYHSKQVNKNYVYPQHQFPIDVSTVDVDQDSDEVSALDMLHSLSPKRSDGMLFPPAVPNFSKKPLLGYKNVNKSHISLDYDYKKAYQNIGTDESTFSVSSHSETECIDNSTRNRYSSTIGQGSFYSEEVSGVEFSEKNSFSDDQSFEQMYQGCHSDRRLECSF